MNWLRRAIIFIKRNRNKSILLLILIFVLGNVMAGAFSILQGSYNVEQMVKKRMPTAVAVDMDQTQIDAAFKEQPDFWNTGDFKNIGLDELNRIAQSPYVEKFNIKTEIIVGSEQYGRWRDPFYRPNESPDSPYHKYSSYRLSGTTLPGVVEIEQGAWQLIEGRTFTQEELDQAVPVGIITKNLAEVNDLSVGDTMTVSAYNFANKEISNETIPIISYQVDVPLHIIGIYQPSEPPVMPKESMPDVVEGELNYVVFADKDGMHDSAYKESKENIIIAPTNLVAQVYREQTSQQLKDIDLPEQRLQTIAEPVYQSVFLLKDPNDLPRFLEESKPLLPKYYTFFQNDNNYSEIAAPLQQVTKLAKSVMIGSAVACGLIVTLVVLLYLRDRRYEFGIYRSLGESRGKLIGQVLSEVLLVAIIAIGLSLITGYMLGSLLSDQMVASQLNALEYTPYIEDNFFGRHIGLAICQD